MRAINYQPGTTPLNHKFFTDLVNGINELQQLAITDAKGPLHIVGNTILSQLQIREWWVGKIKAMAKCSGDCTYLIKKQKCLLDEADADTVPLDDWEDEVAELAGIEVTATNVAELVTNSHSLPVGEIVIVYEVTDEGTPLSTRYLFDRAPRYSFGKPVSNFSGGATIILDPCNQDGVDIDGAALVKVHLSPDRTSQTITWQTDKIIDFSFYDTPTADGVDGQIGIITSPRSSSSRSSNSSSSSSSSSGSSSSRSSSSRSSSSSNSSMSSGYSCDRCSATQPAATITGTAPAGTCNMAGSYAWFFKFVGPDYCSFQWFTNADPPGTGRVLTIFYCIATGKYCVQFDTSSGESYSEDPDTCPCLADRTQLSDDVITCVAGVMTGTFQLVGDTGGDDCSAYTVQVTLG